MAGRKKGKRQILVPEAAQAMDRFKYEMAEELGINPEYKTGYWGEHLCSGVRSSWRPHGTPHDCRGRAQPRRA